MRSSPIYNIIHNESRASDCSFGSYDGFTQDVRVGTSASNSHTLGIVSVRRERQPDGRVLFSLFVDGTCIKRGMLDKKGFRHEA